MWIFYASGKALKLYQIIQMYFLWGKKVFIQLSLDGINRLNSTEENTNELQGIAI